MIKNKIFSEKLKKGIREGTIKSNLPSIPWNKGKGEFLSKEMRDKVTNSLIGKPAWNKGIKLGYIPKMAFQKGLIPWNKGKHMWDNNHPMLGKHHKKESIIKRTESRIKNDGYVSFRKGKKGDINSGSITKERRKNMILPFKDASIEIKIQDYLKQLKINFFTHIYMQDIEHGYQCDVFIPIQKSKERFIEEPIIIECFGDYWHKYPVSRPIDIIRCNELRKAGYRILVFWENEIRVMELDDLNNKIELVSS